MTRRVASRISALISAATLFVLPAVTARASSDRAAAVASAKASLEEMLKKLSSAQQQAMAAEIGKVEGLIKQAEDAIPAIEKIESEIDSSKSHVDLLRAEWQTAQAKSDQLQSQLAADQQERATDIANFSSYEAALFSKWGLPPTGGTRTFTLPAEAALSKQFDADKTEHDAKLATLQKKWSGYSAEVLAATEARKNAASARSDYEDANSKISDLQDQLKTLDDQFNSLVSAAGGTIPTPPSGGSGGGGGGNGGGPELVHHPPGTATSALDQLRATKIDEQGRRNSNGRFNGDCYDMGCAGVKDDGTVFVPNVSPAVAQRLEQSKKYDAAQTKANAAQKAFEEADRAWLKAMRNPDVTPTELQQADQARTKANTAKVQATMELVSFTANLAPEPPKKSSGGSPPPPPPAPGKGGAIK